MPHLVRSGWDDPSFFDSLSDDDLFRAGITNAFHRRQVRRGAPPRSLSILKDMPDALVIICSRFVSQIVQAIHGRI